MQRTVRYPATLAENVTLGAVEIDEDRLGESLAEVELADLSPGEILGEVSYGGREISGGQWQRVGLARAFSRRSGDTLLVLDEPSAALDPGAEASLFHRAVRGSTAGTTVVVSTHHLPNARLASRIVVLEAGRIVEDGSHDELLAKRGLYAHLFRTQAMSYGIEV